MKEIVQNIKNYFSKKERNEVSGNAPDGMCPTCWGYEEWDNQYYKIMRDKHITPGGDRYDSFISKIVDKHVNTTHQHKNVYVCTTCDKEINS
ncbi:MAG: hypothetical protein ACI865_002842 [Flavobacteriaceae bacterium]|jgi:hypothetical protein